MIPRQATLKIHSVGGADGAVGGELDGGPLHEGSGGHDNVAVVAGHGPRLRGHITVHRCSGLDALAEGTHGLPAAQLHRLNDIPAHLPAAGDHTEAQRFIASSCKDSTLYRGGHHCGSQKQSLIETGEQTQIGAHLLAEARCAEPVGAAIDEILSAADIAAGGSQTAAQIFDEASHHHIGPHIRGFLSLHQFAVAVIHHADDVGLTALAEGDQLTDLPHGEGGAGGVALGALDGHQLGFFVDGGPDAVVVKAAVRKQVYLAVADAVFPQGAGRGADADDLLQRVIGRPDGAQQFVARQEVGPQRQCQRMSAAGDLGPDQRRLCVKHIGIDALQIVPALVVVAVAGGEVKVGGIETILVHGGENFGLIILGNVVHTGHFFVQSVQYSLSKIQHLRTDAQLLIHFIGGHGIVAPYLDSFPGICSGNRMPRHFISIRMG